VGVGPLVVWTGALARLACGAMMSAPGLHRRALLLAAVSLAPAAALARIPSNFTFVVPDGWDDLSDGSMPHQLARLHPALVENAMQGDFLAFAADLAPGPDDRTSFMQAVLLPTGIVIAPDTLPKLREALFKRHEAEGLKMDMTTLDITQIRGVDVARAIWSLKGDGVDDMRLAYVVPGGNRAALLVYGATAPLFPKLRPEFERCAAGTGGVEATPRPSRPARLIEGVVSVVAALLAGGWIVSQLRRRPPATPKAARERPPG
jgi:hypothetical protein